MEHYRFRIRINEMIIIRAKSYIEALALADALDDGGHQTWTQAAEVIAAWKID